MFARTEPQKSKITEITITVGGTESAGNYSNVRLDISQTIQIAPGDDPAAVQAAALERLENELSRLFNKALQERGQDARFPVEPFFMLVANWRYWFIAILPKPIPDQHQDLLKVRGNSFYVRTAAFIDVCVSSINEGKTEPYALFDLREEGASVEDLKSFISQKEEKSRSSEVDEDEDIDL